MSSAQESYLTLQVVGAPQPLATRVRVARSLWQRMVGLLGRSALKPGEGLVIEPCRSIHTWFMRFAIDVIFVDNAWQVNGLRENLEPWKTFGVRGGAHAVIELPLGTLAQARVRVGDRITFQ